MTQRYPLTWPGGQPRTPPHMKQYARFDTSQEIAQQRIMDEIWRLGGSDIIISTNIELRKDGMPYASGKPPSDTGVAVYFNFNGNPMAFACDKWIYIKDNMQAIAKTIEALRGIERWGSGEMMRAAFTGFQALPSPEPHWSQVLGVDIDASVDDIETAYRKKARDFHPDREGGSATKMAQLNAARDKAKKERS